MKSRLQMTARNAVWSYVSMIVSLVLSFVSRTIFIYTLGESYLGVSGLFSNILGVLSFAELGIGTAFGFSLYKPVANHDIDKIRSYMHYYKIAYRLIAIVVTIVGLGVLPLLQYIIKYPGNIGNIYIYYLIYLFNTVSSYFVSYKFSLANAEQRNYIFTNINLITTLVITFLQILSLLLFKNFLIYLLVAAAFGLFQKIFVSIYFNKLYPYLKESEPQNLSQEEKTTLKKKVKALIIHKIGDVSVHQTDNIIVSSFISTVMVGLISNYTLIMSTVSSFINILFNSVTGSLGNMIAVESKEHQYSIFKKYRFIGFWFYGFSAIAIAVLAGPFITLWIGENMVIDPLVFNLMMIDYYMIGHRICLNNMKNAAGVFEQDKFVALIQAIVNLIASIVLVNIIGLPGVYIGTIIQGAIATVIKPIVSYKLLFNVSSRYYFKDSIKYGASVLSAYIICFLFSRLILSYSINIITFIVLTVFVAVIPNTLFLLLFRKTEEFGYLKVIIKKASKRLRDKDTKIKQLEEK